MAARYARIAIDASCASMTTCNITAFYALRAINNRFTSININASKNNVAKKSVPVRQFVEDKRIQLFWG